MKIKNIKLFSKIILFLEYIIPVILLILMINFEKLGKIIIFLPWMFLILTLIGFIGLIFGLIMKLEKIDEKLSIGSFDIIQTKFFTSLKKQVIYSSMCCLILGTIGFLFFINFFYFSSF
jgi:hypothetical protein